jgi:hypothetical protein
MSLFMDGPHAVTVTARSAVQLHVFDDAHNFFRSNTEVAFLIARLLAQRLNAATSYLVDLNSNWPGRTLILLWSGRSCKA